MREQGRTVDAVARNAARQGQRLAALGLEGSVGPHGFNAPGDVTRVQDALVARG